MSNKTLRTRLLLLLTCDGSPVPPADITSWLAAGDIACAVLKVSETADAGVLRTTVENLQNAGIAALIENNAECARTVGADGVHLSGIENLPGVFAEAREVLPETAIIGLVARPDRHTAMVLAEQGADYVAFALPEQKEDALWWAEVVEVPSVAFGITTASEAIELSGHGMEFIAVPADAAAIRLIEDAVQDIALVSA